MRRFTSTPGGGGVGGIATGPCRIMASPTPEPSRAFQRATSRARRPDPLPTPLLTQQPLRKIYSLRQFRHLAAQLLHGFEQLLLTLPVPGCALVPAQLFCVGL